MDRTAFEAELQRDGYEIVVNTMQPNQLNADHSHTFDARLMVVAGEMTIACGGDHRTYSVGETFGMQNGRVHSEHAGPDGATYVAGRRKPA